MYEKKCTFGKFYCVGYFYINIIWIPIYSFHKNNILKTKISYFSGPKNKLRHCLIN